MATVLRQVTVRYAEADYWEARYHREPALFEWFFGHTALRRIIRTYLSKKKPLLQIGCGTSNLQEGMARSGYTIVNTDISEIVIKQMQQRHAQYTNMTYRVSDCRSMPEFLDCSFGHVVDKGTMDALLCCKQGTENVMRMLLEVYRVLQPGGSFMLITLGDPTRRLPMLCDPRLPWRVSLLLLPKISAANQAYVDGKPINDSTEPVEAQGPFEVINPDTIMDIPAGVQYSNFFFVYVCKKQPLQLLQYHGQKAALPNGWVAGSKELFQKLQKELGLPEDLLDKGRRKRVMHVPAGHGSMHGLPYPGNSSNASITSGNSSPVSLPALQSGYSSNSIPAAPLGDLQSALTALQLEQQLNGASQRGTPTPPAAPAPGSSTADADADAASPQRDIPARPQSAPNLVAITEAEAAAAAAGAAATPVVEQATTVDGSPAQPAAVQPAGQQHCEHVGQAAAGSITEAAAAAPAGPVLPAASMAACTADLDSGAITSSGMTAAAAAAAESSLPDLAEAAAGSTSPRGVSPQGEQPAVLAPQQQVPPRPAALLVPQLPDNSTASPAAAMSGSPMLVHSVSSPGRLQPGGLVVEQQEEAASTAALVQPPAPAVMQVFNFAAPAALYTPAAGNKAAVAESEGVLDASPLPPMGKAKVAVSSTPTSPASSPSHVSASSQPPPVWPGLKLQTGQVLPQLQGQQALAVSAATAAGMYPHPVAPRGARAPRLRRFSTEYGALSGLALQSQLEQLRLIQAQHSESAADGLVLHDVAAGDSCGSGAAAAAAIAAAAWGCVRRPRDRRLSNISILSGLSVMSSTSIDESGEEALYDGQCSASNTGICSSEPSCQLWGGATHPETVQEGSSSNGNSGTAPKGPQPPLAGSQQVSN